MFVCVCVSSQVVEKNVSFSKTGVDVKRALCALSTYCKVWLVSKSLSLRENIFSMWQ